jgi:WD40 repeat protein
MFTRDTGESRQIVRRFLFPFVLFLIAPMAAPAKGQGATDEPPPADEVVDTGKLVMAFETGGHVAPIKELVFTPDSKRIISIGEDRTVQIWNVATGQRLSVLRLPGDRDGGAARPNSAAISPDGKTLLVGGSGLRLEPGKPLVNLAYLLNLKTGQILPLLGPDAVILTVAFAADGDRAFAAHGGACWIWTGLKDVWQRDVDPAGIPAAAKVGNAKYSWPAHISATSDGNTLALISNDAKLPTIWDVRSPDKPEKTAKLPTGDLPIQSMAWSPDCRRIATIRYSPHTDTKNVVCIWSVEGKQLKSFSTQELTPGDTDYALIRVLFRSDNELLLFGHKASTRFVVELNLDKGTAREICRTPQSFDGNAVASAVSPDRQFGAFSHGPGATRVVLFKIQDKAPLRYLAGSRFSPEQIGWAPKGLTIAWNANNAAKPDSALDLKELQPLGNFVAETLVRPMNKRGEWEISDGSNPGTSYLSIRQKGKEIARTPASGSVIRSHTLPAQGDVRWIALAQGWGLTLNEPATGKVIRRFRVSYIEAVASSPDNQYLLAAANNQLLYICSPDQPDPLLMAFVSGPNWVVWTPKDGYYAASPGGERLVGWTVNNGTNQLASFYPAERFRKLMYRPDIIKLVLDKGSVREALAAVSAKSIDLEQALPPRATIESFQVDEKQGTATLKILAQSNAGQPIKALRLLLDGRSFPDGRFTESNVKSGARVEIEWKDVPLPPGKHELKVLVRGPDSADVSEPQKVVTPLPEDQKPVMHVVAVGINNYKNVSLNLKSAENDARDIVSALRESCTGKFNRFREVKGDAILSEKATTENVLNALTEVRKGGARPGDLVVFFFAGHGMRETIQRAGKDVPEFFLLTHEADPKNLEKTALAGSKLREALKDMPCQVLLILDACHSGAGIGNFVPITDDLTRSMTDDEAAVTVLAAALPNETAGEEQGNGRLTRALKTVLKGGEGVPYDPYDHVMHIHHIYTRVYDEVRNESKGKQNPMLLAPWTMPPVVIRNVTEQK